MPSDEFAEGDASDDEELADAAYYLLRVVRVVSRGEPEPVYNLEVQFVHVYHVTAAGVLVHNGTNCSVIGQEEKKKTANKVSGDAREAVELKDLQAKYPNTSVQRERYLRTADGKIARDPLTGEGRRIDFAVIENGKAEKMVETTSETANKIAQSAKEARIRDAGGTFIRDRATRKLIDVSKVPTELSRKS